VPVRIVQRSPDPVAVCVLLCAEGNARTESLDAQIVLADVVLYRRGLRGLRRVGGVAFPIAFAVSGCCGLGLDRSLRLYVLALGARRVFALGLDLRLCVRLIGSFGLCRRVIDLIRVLWLLIVLGL